MRSPLRAGTLAASLLLGTALVIPATQAVAQDHFSISFSEFHNRLGDYGDWVYSDRWGEVWIPADVPADFHPYYTDGHWVYTDYYGWMWVSDYDWGDITFHYGRWVDDPEDGWMWIPGYVWSPAWVVWRSNGDYVGWMPMPPDEQFLRGVSFGISSGPLSFGVNFGDTGGYYGYSRWYPDYDEDMFASDWVFVGKRYIADRNFRGHIAPRRRYRMLLQNTRDVTHYTVQNNYIVNRSIAVSDVEHASGHRIPHVQARTVIKNPQFITNVNVGVDIQKRARSERPHGTGEQGSAPKPSSQVINTLSQDVRNKHVRNKQHLFTKQNVQQGDFGHGGPNAGPNANQPNMQQNTGPNEQGPGQRHGHEEKGPNNAPGTNNMAPQGQPENLQPNGPGTETHRHGQHEENGPNNAPGTNNMTPQGQPENLQPNGPGSETHRHGRHEENGTQNNNETNPTNQTEPSMPGKNETNKPGEQHATPPGAPPSTLPPPNANPQGGPNENGPGTSETPRGHHERGHHEQPGSETNQPNNGGTETPPGGGNGADHMQHDNSHAVHDRNTPTMPNGQPTTEPDHGNQPNATPPEKGKHHENQGDNGQGDKDQNDKRHKHDENNPPPQ